ncbi:uncharacterized protein [Ptychodera flava]|uniref:uncharacterized protein n=1 Tax=Ptychodera flava TaxID=63121 RepID=UPI00396A547F
MASTTIGYRPATGSSSVPESYQGNHSPAGNNFPVKLWKLCSEKKYRSIQWGPGGRSIVVNSSIFKDEVLNDAFGMFKTQNFSSFVRQLNLYGFRKIPTARSHETFDINGNCDLHHFQHTHFLQTRPDLLAHVRRSTAASRRKAAAAQNSYCYSHPRPPKLSHSAPTRQPVFKQHQLLPSFRELLGSHRNVNLPSNHQRMQNANVGQVWPSGNVARPATMNNRNHRYAPYPTELHYHQHHQPQQDRNVARNICDDVIQANINTRNLPQGIPPSVLFFPPRSQQQNVSSNAAQVNPSTSSSSQQFNESRDHSEYPGLALLADTASNSPEMKQSRNALHDEKKVFIVEDKKDAGQHQVRPTTQYYIIKDSNQRDQLQTVQNGHSQFQLMDGNMPRANNGQVVLQLPMVQSQTTPLTSFNQMTQSQSTNTYAPITAYLPPGSYINTSSVPNQSNASFLTVSPSHQVLTQFSVSPMQSPHKVQAVNTSVSPPPQSPDKVFSDLTTIPIVSLVQNPTTNMTLDETSTTEDEKAVKSLLLNSDSSFNEETVMIIPEEDIPVQKTVQIPAQVSEEKLVIRGVRIPAPVDSRPETSTGSEESTTTQEVTTVTDEHDREDVSNKSQTESITLENSQEHSSDLQSMASEPAV